MADPGVDVEVDIRLRNPGREANFACSGVIVGAFGVVSVEASAASSAGGAVEEGRPARMASRSRTASGICLLSPVLARASR